MKWIALARSVASMRQALAARNFADKVEVGMVGINVPIPVPLAFHSFGVTNVPTVDENLRYGLLPCDRADHLAANLVLQRNLDIVITEPGQGRFWPWRKSCSPRA
jgi:hypothetical protein